VGTLHYLLLLCGTYGTAKYNPQLQTLPITANYNPNFDNINIFVSLQYHPTEHKIIQNHSMSQIRMLKTMRELTQLIEKTKFAIQ
jgi:hypothetical protein